MRNSSDPPPSSSGSRGPLIILIAGMVILLAAGAVFLKKRSSSTDTAVRKTPVILEKTPAAPLVIQEPGKPAGSAPESPPDHTPQQKHEGAKGEPTGTINAREVNAFINARFGQVKSCYERRLRNDNSLEGKLDLNIHIASSGKVSWVGVNRDTVRDKEMLSCVKRTIRGWDFPKPIGGKVVVAKTFRFKKKL